MTNTIVVDTEFGSFEFRTNETVQDKFRIKSEAVNLYGRGVEGFMELDELIERKRTQYTQFNVDRLGEAKTEQLIGKVNSELIPESERAEALKELVEGNSYWNSFASLKAERTNLLAYAKLKVLCIKKPEDFDFYKASEEEVFKIIDYLEQQKVFFRK